VNRYFRRLARFGKSYAARRSQGTMPIAEVREPDQRAKSSGHGKEDR